MADSIRSIGKANRKYAVLYSSDSESPILSLRGCCVVTGLPSYAGGWEGSSQRTGRPPSGPCSLELSAARRNTLAGDALRFSADPFTFSFCKQAKIDGDGELVFVFQMP